MTSQHPRSTGPESQRGYSASAPSIIVFDVNETLIDIESIGILFEKVFGDRKVLREWFNQLILYSNVITLAGYYETFFALGQGVLEMLGAIYGASINPENFEELKTSMFSMPAHKDPLKDSVYLRRQAFG